MFISMKRMLTLALGSALLLAATASVHAQDSPEPERRKFRIGPEVGFFLPTDAKTKDRFGDNWFTLGIGLGAVPRPDGKGRLGLNLNVLAKNKGDNRALIIPVGLRYRQGFNNNPEASFSPYAGGSLDAYLIDVRSPQDNVDSGFRATGGGSVFVGFAAAEKAFLEARYLFVGEVKGFDFSGFNIVGGYRF